MDTGRNRGRGYGGGYALGPGGACVCPRCGYRTFHTRGVQCYLMRCPRCGSMMIRA